MLLPSAPTTCLGRLVKRNAAGGARALVRGQATTPLSTPAIATLAHQHPPRSTAAPRASANGNSLAASSMEAEEEELSCGLVFVTMDNSGEHSTKLTVEAMNNPGLLQSICWAINGLGAKVLNATIKTEADGQATDTFYLVSRVTGKKLSDTAAAAIKERLQDFIAACTAPVPKEMQQEWASDNTHVSNSAHEQYTVVTISGEVGARAGFLLEIVSVMTGTGAQVHEAVIQGSAEFADVAPPGYDFAKNGRIFRFFITSRDGAKLDANRISALLFTLAMVMGRGHTPLSPPNASNYSVRAFANHR